jgi:hypothetical protein
VPAAALGQNVDRGGRVGPDLGKRWGGHQES